MNELIALEKIAQWEKLKALVLDSVSSPITKRVYNMALNEFMAWFQQAPRPGFTKATVSAWRVSLEERRLGSSSIIIRMSAIRKLAAEAADNGLLAPELAQGTLPLKYWLHRLFLDLRANNSPLIRIHNDTGGFIEHLFEASAIYCARLDRRSLEKTVMPGEDSSVKQGVASPDAIAEPERRRGYRTEVRQWMALEGLRTIEAAARHLGISHSSLKSIMSDRGKCRYGEERLSRVLGRIGYKGE